MFRLLVVTSMIRGPARVVKRKTSKSAVFAGFFCIKVRERAVQTWFQRCKRPSAPASTMMNEKRPGGEIGRRKGLKILFAARRVRVQVPPRAPGIALPDSEIVAKTPQHLVIARECSHDPQISLVLDKALTNVVFSKAFYDGRWAADQPVLDAQIERAPEC